MLELVVDIMALPPPPMWFVGISSFLLPSLFERDPTMPRSIDSPMGGISDSNDAS